MVKKINDLQIGKSGEYLVCADLILKGFIAYPSEQGLPYDVILDDNGKLYKIQVKTTRGPKHIAQRKIDIPAYIFHIGNNGKMNRRRKYESSQVDIFALVALDTRTTAYFRFFDCQTTMNFRVPAHRGKYHDEIGLATKQKVTELRQQGMSCEDIAERLSMTLSNVYKYSANVSIEQKGTNAGVYFDQFSIEKCLNHE